MASLTEQEKQWFDYLTTERSNLVRYLRKAGMIDIFISHIVDTYRESAHFIFELLQNADDAHATSARFQLLEDGIIFAHNGTEAFTISNPDTEREDPIAGHINAITTFSLSSKREDIENKIGKFGIGFKSVFQYTASPHVYAPPFNFKIDDYMIPRQISADPSKFKKGETTVFWLPFNKNEKKAEQSYTEILQKINQTTNPLLFLRNLVSVEFEHQKTTTNFSKVSQREQKINSESIQAHRVELNKDKILRFDRLVPIKDAKGKSHSLTISVAFITNEFRNIVSDPEYLNYFGTAWCFFPTFQETRLNYILNAPFILTPNREALKEDRTENQQLLNFLGDFLADSLDALKELGLINEQFFTTLTNPEKLPKAFKEIGLKLKAKLATDALIPTKEGDHIQRLNAFVCTEESLAELLSYNSYEPLKRLTGLEDPRIVFRDRTSFDNELFVFVYKEFSAAKAELQATWLGSEYTTSFIEGMPEEFDILFFKYISTHVSTILGKNQPLWKKAFIPVEKGVGNFDLVKAINSKGEPNVFMEGRKIEERNVLQEYLSKDEELKPFFTGVLQFPIPDEFDDFLTDLKKYKTPEALIRKEVFEDILLIKRYINELSQFKKDKLIAALKSIPFLPIINADGNQDYENPQSNVVYFPSPELKAYFKKANTAVVWMDTDPIKLRISNSELLEFAKILEVEVVPFFFNDDDNLVGLPEYIQEISLAESLYLAHVLIIREPSIYFNKHLTILRFTPWLFDSATSINKPDQIKSGDLHEKYPTEFQKIHIELGPLPEAIDDRYENLNENEKGLLEAINPFLSDLTPEEIKAALLAASRSKKKRSPTTTSETIEDLSEPEKLVERWTGESVRKIKKEAEQTAATPNHIPTFPKPSTLWDSPDEQDAEPENPGEYVSAPVIGNSYREKQESQKRIQLGRELEIESRRNELIDLAGRLKPYTYGWFKVLLELEDNFTAEDRIKKNPVRAVFGKAELDDDGLLTLSESPYVPPNIEDIGEIAVQIFFNDQKKTIKGEVISPKKKIVKIKLSNPDQLHGITLSEVSRVIVETSSPDFILEKLKNAFIYLQFPDDYELDAASNLPSDINFIFGPPGTGKTTYLSWLIGGKHTGQLQFAGKPISPLLADASTSKVLVLTPTNKAADVLVEKIISNYNATNSYPTWLIRFGQTGSLENEPVFYKEKVLPSWVASSCVLVTTIARFPYDFFKVERKDAELDDWNLRDFPWDYIIFDEASMINQAAILYVIYYTRLCNPKIKFFVGGDPFQIPPIIKFEFPNWSYIPEPAFDNEGAPILDEHGTQLNYKQDGGNLYSFVGLMNDESFTKLQTRPHQFPIHRLTVQYRSIQPIGSLFSNYRYGGILAHHRSEANIKANQLLRSKPLTINKLKISPLTLIKFPVKKYEGVYRVRSIKGSPYQMYSAIFTIELLKFLEENTETSAPTYKVGVITPYAIQNAIVTRFVERSQFKTLTVSTGTVHGFQGDECDLVIVLLNPPTKITRQPRTFLNKKNILNVAISRARDKMIFLTPFDPDGEINTHDLHQIKWIEHLANKLPDCRNQVSKYVTSDLEKLLWGSETFIEDNTFPTSHQDVNIYTDAAKKYEIRQDENALDIQIRTQ